MRNGTSKYLLPAVAGIVAALAAGLLKTAGIHSLLLRVMLVGVATGAALFAWRRWVA